MKTNILLLAALLSTATFAATGCASATDSASSAESNLEETAEYDAVVAAPGQLVNKNDTTPTADRSFLARTIAFYDGNSVDEVGAQLVKFQDWVQIREDDGSQPFHAAAVESDTTSGGVRTISGTFKLKDNFSLSMKATITTDAEGDILVQAVNTSAITVPGTAIEVAGAGKLVINVKVGAYPGGTIVDGTMSAKASSPVFESQAAGRLMPVLPAIVKWSRSSLQ